MPEKKVENSPKTAREWRFFPEKIFENLNPRKQKCFPRKKGETVPEKATKVPEKNIYISIFVCTGIFYRKYPLKQRATTIICISAKTD